jgi:glycosyltransferase involved in cell wall biosynthesis
VKGISTYIQKNSADNYYLGTAVVSVIIPCYKQAHFLGDAIESVLAQRDVSYEVIVIDDGSPDNTAEVVARYPRVRYVWQANQGLSSARNTGIRESHGNYLVFLDADDRLLADALHTGLACLLAHPECGFGSGHHRYITVDGAVFNEYPPEPIDDNSYLALLKRNYIGMHATVIYRRAVFDAVGGFDPTLKSCEDYDMYLRIARRMPIFRHHHLVAEYRWHGANMTYNTGRMLQAALRVLRAQQEYIADKPAYISASRVGVRFWRQYFGQLALQELRASVRQHDWRQVARNMLMLVMFFPHWLSAVAIEVRLAFDLARYT